MEKNNLQVLLPCLPFQVVLCIFDSSIDNNPCPWSVIASWQALKPMRRWAADFSLTVEKVSHTKEGIQIPLLQYASLKV